MATRNEVIVATRNPFEIPQAVIRQALRMSKKALEETRIYHDPDGGGWAVATIDDLGDVPARFYWVATIDPMSDEPTKVAPARKHEFTPAQREKIGKSKRAEAKELEARKKVFGKRGLEQRERLETELQKEFQPPKRPRPRKMAKTVQMSPETTMQFAEFWINLFEGKEGIEEVLDALVPFYLAYGDDFDPIDLLNGFGGAWVRAGGSDTQEEFNALLVDYLNKLAEIHEQYPERELKASLEREHIIYPMPKKTSVKSRWGERGSSKGGTKGPVFQARMPRPDAREMMSWEQKERIRDVFWNAYRKWVASEARKREKRRLSRREPVVSVSSGGTFSMGSRRKKKSRRRRKRR